MDLICSIYFFLHRPFETHIASLSFSLHYGRQARIDPLLGAGIGWCQIAGKELSAPQRKSTFGGKACN